MNIRRLELKNFLSHKNTELDVSNRNPVIVVGENGVGKAAMLKDSVTWALFGKARGGGDEVITEGESVGLVRLEFSVGNDYYVVERVRERGKKTILNLSRIVELMGGGESINGATIAETQKKIEGILGVDYDTFVCTACVEQGRADAFSTLTPKEAKQVLMRILRLESYERCADVARKTVTTLQNQMAAIDAQRISYEKDLVSLDSAKDVSTDVETKIKNTTISKDTITLRLKEIGDSVELERCELENLKVQQGENQVHELHIKEAVKKSSARLTYLSSPLGECPLCRSSLSESHLATVRTQLGNEINKGNIELTRLEEVRMSVAQRSNERSESLTSLYAEDSKLQAQLIKTDDELTKLYEERIVAKANAEQRRRLREKMDELEQSGAKLRVDFLRYSLLEDAFGKNGIPALVIENVIPEIETTANKLLEMLTDGKMGLRIRTQKELKTGGIGDTLDIEIFYLTNSRLYSMMSGGERFRIDLALRVALSSVLARRNSYQIETLIVDEGFGSLDAIGRQKFVQLADALKEQFKRIIIVTHTDIADMYAPDELITVRRENGYSKISV